MVRNNEKKLKHSEEAKNLGTHDYGKIEHSQTDWTMKLILSPIEEYNFRESLRQNIEQKKNELIEKKRIKSKQRSDESRNKLEKKRTESKQRRDRSRNELEKKGVRQLEQRCEINTKRKESKNDKLKEPEEGEGKKICPNCKLTKANSYFGRPSSKRLPSWCKKCVLIRSKTARQKEILYRQELQIKQGCCADCKSTDDINELEAAHYKRGTHHISKNGKISCFSHMSVTQMKANQHKIRFLCKECHCRETEQENLEKKVEPKNAAVRQVIERTKQKQEYVNNRKRAIGACLRCTKTVATRPYSYFHFDHLPGFIKIEEVSLMIQKNRNIEVIDAEIAKCQLLCANCHFKVTAERLRMEGEPNETR